MLRYVFTLSLFFVFNAIKLQAQQSFITGKTTGNLPYLEYGLGDDRLGGAKMSFLDTNVVVRVVDSTRDDYKVWLSKDHFAYMPKSSFTPDTTVVSKLYYLTGSWKCYGDSTYDYLTVSLDERLPYRSMQTIDPSTIVIDVFGATSNTNWITQLLSAKEIKNVWYEQVEDDVFRVTISLKHQQHWGYRIYYEGNRLVVKINRQPASLKLEGLRIAVDAGHGGENMGARGSKTKILEKDYTLRFAGELKKVLEKEKAIVSMTREKDTTLSMVERMQMIRQDSAQLLISIHLNSSGRDSISGTSTYYRYIGFRPLTQTIYKRMLQLGLAEFGNVGGFNFSLSGPTDYPNCLVEVAFLSNREDEQRILDPQFRQAVAKKIVEGIKDWLNIVSKQPLN